MGDVSGEKKTKALLSLNENNMAQCSPMFTELNNNNNLTLSLKLQKALHRKGIYLKSTGSEKGLKKSGLTRLRFGDRVYGMRRLTVILEFNIEGNLGTNSFYLNS